MILDVVEINVAIPFASEYFCMLGTRILKFGNDAIQPADAYKFCYWNAFVGTGEGIYKMAGEVLSARSYEIF